MRWRSGRAKKSSRCWERDAVTARGTLPGSGATACLDVFTLAEFEAALKPYAIRTLLRDR